MGLSSNGHGKGRGAPHVELTKIDDLPAGVPALSGPVAPPIARTGAGHPADRAAAKEMGRRGGAKKARNERERNALCTLAKNVLPASVSEVLPEVAAELPAAEEMVQRVTAELARDVGGGVCPDFACTMVVSAALQALASRIQFARGDFKSASSLADSSRQNLCYATEYTIKLARKREPADPDLDTDIAKAAKRRGA